MIIGDHLSFELSESLFDLCAIQFHNVLHWLACRSAAFLRNDP
jgi:hypothetical protein